MSYARIRHAMLFWFWGALLLAYTVGGAWLLYQGAREQALRFQSVVMVVQPASGNALIATDNE